MTREGWKKVIISTRCSSVQLDLLAKFLEEIDQATQILRDKGYGHTGKSLLETVKQLPI